MWIDIHCHLDQFENPEYEIECAREQGVGIIAAMSEDEFSMQKVIELKKKFPGRIYAGLGIHPAKVSASSEQDIINALNYLAACIENADFVGEIGLDFKYAVNEEMQKLQYQFLEKQFEIAKLAKKPVILHSRWALRQTMDQAIRFQSETNLGTLLHWFTHSVKLIRITNKNKIYVSVGPSVLFSNETENVVKQIDPDLLLLETDAPVAYHGSSAKPSWIPMVGLKVAALLGIPEKKFETLLEQNFWNFINRS